jgi:hypothetical protein
MLILCPGNFGYLHPQTATDPIIAIAKHDSLYWVIVRADDIGKGLSSNSGSETKQAALQKIAEAMAVRVWSKAKDSGITLSK